MSPGDRIPGTGLDFPAPRPHLSLLPSGRAPLGISTYRQLLLSTALQLMCFEPVSLDWTFRILVLSLDVSSSVTFS